LFLTCREVEDFARRLNSVWNESHIGGNGSVQRFPGMFSICNFLDEDSGTIVVIQEKFVGEFGEGNLLEICRPSINQTL
jgi:hypothetical protein